MRKFIEKTILYISIVLGIIIVSGMLLQGFIELTKNI